MATYEAKTKPTTVTAADYIAAIEDVAKRVDAETIDAMLRRVSGESPVMWGPSIIGYGSYHYRYDSGHEGDACRIGFSPRKAEHVLYFMGTYGDDRPEAAALLNKLGKCRRGKSCLYVRKLTDVDLDVLEQLARFSWAEMARLYPPSA